MTRLSLLVPSGDYCSNFDRRCGKEYSAMAELRGIGSDMFGKSKKG